MTVACIKLKIILPNAAIRCRSGTPVTSNMELFVGIALHWKPFNFCHRQMLVCNLDPRSFSKISFYNYHIDSSFHKSQLNWTIWKLFRPIEKLLWQIFKSEVELFVTIIYSWKCLTTLAKIFSLCYLMMKWWINEITLRNFTLNLNENLYYQHLERGFTQIISKIRGCF